MIHLQFVKLPTKGSATFVERHPFPNDVTNPWLSYSGDLHTRTQAWSKILGSQWPLIPWKGQDLILSPGCLPSSAAKADGGTNGDRKN